MNSSSPARNFQFEGFELDGAARRLVGPDGTVELPSRAFDVLLYMVKRPGELLDKAAILAAVWPVTVVEENILSQCIFTLRRALGDSATEPRFIATIPGRGYQFVAPVRTAVPGIAQPLVAGRGSGQWLYVGAAIAILVVLFGAWRFRPAAATITPPETAT